MDPEDLVAARQALNLEQTELARILGVPRSTVWRWEHDQRGIPSYIGWALEGIAHHRGQCLQHITGCDAHDQEHV